MLREELKAEVADACAISSGSLLSVFAQNYDLNETKNRIKRRLLLVTTCTKVTVKYWVVSRKRLLLLSIRKNYCDHPEIKVK